MILCLLNQVVNTLVVPGLIDFETKLATRPENPFVHAALLREANTEDSFLVIFVGLSTLRSSRSLYLAQLVLQWVLAIMFGSMVVTIIFDHCDMQNFISRRDRCGVNSSASHVIQTCSSLSELFDNKASLTLFICNFLIETAPGVLDVGNIPTLVGGFADGHRSIRIKPQATT